jgi:hypothetical protein
LPKVRRETVEKIMAVNGTVQRRYSIVLDWHKQVSVIEKWKTSKGRSRK